MNGVNDDPVAVLQRWEDAVSVVKGLRGGRIPIRHRRVVWGLAASVTKELLKHQEAATVQ